LDDPDPEPNEDGRHPAKVTPKLESDGMPTTEPFHYSTVTTAPHVEPCPPAQSSPSVASTIPELDLDRAAERERDAIEGGMTPEEIAAVTASLDELDLGDVSDEPDNCADTTPETVKPDALKPDALKPDALKPDALKPDAVMPEPVKPDAAQAALQAANEEVRRIVAEKHALTAKIRELVIQEKAAKLQAGLARDLVRSFERAEAAEGAADMTWQEKLSASNKRFSRPKSDPATKKANKAARDRRHLAKVAADPRSAKDRRRVRNEAQKRRRRGRPLDS
jgi:hypothetical protein